MHRETQETRRGRPRSGQLMKAIFRNPKKFIERGRKIGFSKTGCLHVLEFCDVLVNENPRKGKQLASIGVRIANCTDDSCLKARSFGVLGSALRDLEFYKLAKRALDVAIDIAGHCDLCLVDLYFRLAHVAHCQKSKAAFCYLDQAVRFADNLEDDDWKGRILFLRGYTEYCINNNVNEALDMNERAIHLITTEKYSEAACNAMVVYLTHGSTENKKRALKIVGDLRPKWRKRGIMTARLKWTEALLWISIGTRHKKAWRLLNEARRSFISARMANEVVAITADMAQYRLSSVGNIEKVVSPVMKLDFLPQDIYLAIRKLWRSLDSRAWGSANPQIIIGKTIKELRSLIGDETLPHPVEM